MRTSGTLLEVKVYDIRLSTPLALWSFRTIFYSKKSVDFLDMTGSATHHRASRHYDPFAVILRRASRLKIDYFIYNCGYLDGSDLFVGTSMPVRFPLSSDRFELCVMSTS